ncbi:MAG: DNA-processing protein DprA [Candidatus Dojkabacteria bacterium]
MEDSDKLKNIILNLRLKSDLSNSKLLNIIANFANLTKIEYSRYNISSIDDYNIPHSLTLLDTQNISYKFILDSDYPENLRNIKNPPAIIFYKGTWRTELFYKTISIVGTRTPTESGKKFTRKISSELSSNGFTVISGMAFGIDKEAHLGCLQVNGDTIAVLASSPNVPTPANNTDLYKEILDNGGIVLSDAFPGQEVSRWSFAARNRIVAALSQAILVVEAGEKSGALITAELGSKYKKHVFAVPGNTDSIVSIGTNNLIKSGNARLVTTIDDILNAMDLPKNQSVIGSQNLKNLTDKEIRTYNALIDSMYVEQINAIVKSDISDTIGTLSSLELKGYISLTTEGKYKRVANLN